MKVKEYINNSFEKWWEKEQGDRMPKSKYLARKAWVAAHKDGWPLFLKVQEKLGKKYEEVMFGK